jgi:hypothetical protein
MKKELLIASALTASFGLAGVAEAATASFAGNVRNGVSGSDLDDTTTASYSSSQQASLTFSVSETTDSGVKWATGFNIMDENTSDVGASSASGLTLTFTDGSSLQVIEAGNAYGAMLATVPSASGEQGITDITSNVAPTGLDFADTSDNVGVDWRSAADFGGIEGMTLGVSAAFGDDGDASTTSTAETSYSVGVTYTTSAGDTAVTVGGGFINADDSNNTTLNDKADSVALSGTAVTGDLTVGVGYASGSMIASGNIAADAATEVDSASVTTFGAKYVSGDMTFNIGMVDGEAKDGAAGSDGTNTDTHESVSASIDYAVAAGVTATLGYTDVSNQDEGVSKTANSGSSWYIGANVSF